MFEYWQEELHIKFIVAENVFFFKLSTVIIYGLTRIESF